LVPNFRKINKVIIHWHGDDIFPSTFFSRLLNAISYKFIKADFIHIAPSNYFATETAKRLSIEPDHILISPSGGVDTELFHLEDRTGNPAIVRLGFASGLLHSKGMGLVMQLLQDVNEIENALKVKIEFHYIDYGKERKYFNKQLSLLSNVVKHNPYPIKGMVDFYKNIDILLFPSLRKAESLGLVSIEAMSCGIPVIATDDFAFKNTVISGLTGKRFEKGNVTAFRNALIYCIAQKNNYAARDFVIHNYGREAVMKGYVTMLR